MQVESETHFRLGWGVTRLGSLRASTTSGLNHKLSLRLDLRALAHRSSRLSVATTTLPAVPCRLRLVLTSEGVCELLSGGNHRAMEVGARTSGKDRGVGHPQPRDPMDAPSMIDDRRRVGRWSHAARTRRVKRRLHVLPHLSTALVTGTPYGQWSGERLDHRGQRRCGD